MRIRHFQGYGVVNAKKVSKNQMQTYLGVQTKLVIELKGNHECGLVRDDLYDLFNWIFTKFEKSLDSYTQIKSYSYEEDYVNGTDICTYTFIY